MSSIHVLKFGGSSLQNASLINQAVTIIAERSRTAQPVVVVSAVGGVTDRLAELAGATEDTRESSPSGVVDALRQHHLALYEELIDEPHREPGYNGLAALFDELRQVAADRQQRRRNLPAWRDHLLSFGERASVRLIEAALQYNDLAARKLEAHHFIKTDQVYGEANVRARDTRNRIRRAVSPAGAIPVITGFIGSAADGSITTLGRSGSDYTASLVADALDADHLEIWTDVNGVLTADPDLVPDAQSIDVLNFEDIAELAMHGVGVIHSKTIQPIRDRDISLLVRNSHNLDHPGTHIHKAMPSNGNFRSVTVNGPYVYIQLDDRHAGALSRLIEEQASADTEVFSCWRNARNEPARFTLRTSLFEEAGDTIRTWASDHEVDLDIRHDIFKVKKFTNSLRDNDSSLTQLFDVLLDKGIRPLSVNRNHNQRHITLLLEREQARNAARSINRYWIDRRKTIPLFIAGTGAVGGTLIDEIGRLDHPKYNFDLLGHCNSRQCSWKAEKHPTRWPEIQQKLEAYPSSNIIFVDATGSEEVARLYPQLFAAGIHVVTPSKLANTFGQHFYNQLRDVAQSHGTAFRYETTVGAGLPVISTLEDLQASGDRVTAVSGVVSGTMTYLFERLEAGVPFSKAIVEARKKGYAEPDPRDDLSGEDVARKFLTLAREIGWQIERDDLQVESLIPDALSAVDSDTFLQQLPDYDKGWNRKLQQARDAGRTLRYVGRLADGTIDIGVQEVSQRSPLGQLRGTDNLIRIQSERYRNTPMIIQGPGAGKEVTAAGVLCDIIKAAADIN